jgi:multimeric flavodoxin WrbA
MMGKKAVIISGSPKKHGNTAMLVEWFIEGLRSKGCRVELVRAAFLKYRAVGCISCRLCQTRKEYGCVVADEASPVLARMAEADIIVFATPLYFFGMSAQSKIIMDRMFSLYKWDNRMNTMKTPLKGRTLALLASAYEGEGMSCLEKPFKITADYSGMKFASLLVPHAGVSGKVEKRVPSAKRKAIAFGRKVARL